MDGAKYSEQRKYIQNNEDYDHYVQNGLDAVTHRYVRVYKPHHDADDNQNND